MISPGMSRCATVLVLALMCPVAWGAEPNEVPIQLQFEISPTPLGPYFLSAMGSEWQPFASRRPAYAVAIPLVPPIEWLPSPARQTMDNFVGNARYGGYIERQTDLSEQQKEFLRAAKTLLNNPHTSLLMDRPDPNGPPRVLLYALTLEDARKMAEAYFQYARNDWWRGYLGALSKKVQESTEEVAREQKKLSEVDRLIEASQKPLADFQKTVPYRTESEARDAIGDLDRMLNAAQVEIAGIKAKMQAVMKHQRESEARRRSQDVIEKLDMMYIEEAVVLQGAEARQKMATSLRERASRYIDLKSTLSKATGERELLVVNLEADQKALTDRQRELEATRQQEPKIPDKILVYPVKWAEEVPTN